MSLDNQNDQAPAIDLSSVLDRLNKLESDRDELQKQLEAERESNQRLREKSTNLREALSKTTPGKQAEEAAAKIERARSQIADDETELERLKKVFRDSGGQDASALAQQRHISLRLKRAKESVHGNPEDYPLPDDKLWWPGERIDYGSLKRAFDYSRTMLDANPDNVTAQTRFENARSSLIQFQIKHFPRIAAREFEKGPRTFRGGR